MIKMLARARDIMEVFYTTIQSGLAVIIHPFFGASEARRGFICQGPYHWLKECLEILQAVL